MIFVEKYPVTLVERSGNFNREGYGTFGIEGVGTKREIQYFF